jgi:hypothetical protein
MDKSATDVMQEIIFSSFVDTLSTLKDVSKGMPNTLLRDINAIHVNSTFGDLPTEVQAIIKASVRSAFIRLGREGYHVAAGDAQPRIIRSQGAKPSRHNGSPKRSPNQRG